MTSLVLLSRAIRSNDDEGMVLAFENLDAAQREQLEKIIAFGGQIVETGDPYEAGFEAEDFLVIGELLEEIEWDDTIKDADSLVDTDESVEDTP
jgi:hypothetical protein